MMQLRTWHFDLKLARTWAIASRLGPGGSGGTDFFRVVFVELQGEDGVIGRGEAAPSTRYAENPETVAAFLAKVQPAELSFTNLEGSLAYLESVHPGNAAAKAAVEMALFDGTAERARQPLWKFLDLKFADGQYVTSFSIGIDSPDVIREKVKDATEYPILKLKLGTPQDEEILAALREVAPEKTIRVDGNEGWTDKEMAIRKLEWLAKDGHIQFVEQPMPARTKSKDLAWLKARSPLPLMADESYRSTRDLDVCGECFHAVNVKLVKTGGVICARDALQKAQAAGLKTMLGCMIESSVLISAAAHLASLTDYLDLDGNVLTLNDPFQGVRTIAGVLSFEDSPRRFGLQVAPRRPLEKGTE